MLRDCCNNNRAIDTLPRSARTSRQAEITLPFQGARKQIGDASAGADHLRALIGPAAERHFDCAGIRAADRGGADLARWPDSCAAEGGAGVAARCASAADRRRRRSMVSGTSE